MNTSTQRWGTVGLILTLVILLLGCSGIQQAANRQKRANELKAVGLAYHNFNDTYARGPANAGEIAPFLQDFPEALQAVQSGDLVVIWGAKIPSDFPEGTANTILGYEKDAPTKGGQVLLADASVRPMSAKDFQAAPRPKQKGS
jgi:hypothetical protein